jgi:hypothetical protein
MSCLCELLNLGKAPPVLAVGLRMKDRLLFSLADGNHRVVAALEAGQMIRTEIAGYYTIKPPEDFVIWEGGLWEQEEGTRQCVAFTLNPMTEFVLRDLGVID